MLGAGGPLICQVRDDTGAVVEEIKVEGDPASDQLVVWLETPGGRRALVGLKRPRQP